MSEPVKPEMDIELTSTITFKRRVRKDWWPSQFTLDDIVHNDNVEMECHIESLLPKASDIKITTGAKLIA